MLIFIPAWYKNDEWCENEQEWYSRRMHSEFDDTVKQIQLFHRNSDFEYTLCVLGFTPNLRHFLHRQGVYNVPYWSCFDAICECKKKKATVFSYQDLRWLPHTEFVYTPFVINAQIHGMKYAQLYFGEDGNLIRVDMYEGENVAIRNIYDDRGFVASAIMYSNKEPVYQDYYTDKGIWKIRIFFEDGHVEINEERNFFVMDINNKEERIPFSCYRYASLDDVIKEIFAEYLKRYNNNDIYCVAMHKLNAKIIEAELKNKKIIISLFENRYQYGDVDCDVELLEKSNYMVTDSKITTSSLISYIGKRNDRMVDITPYDTRKDMGISQQLTVQKILVPVDGLEDELFDKMILIFADYVEKNDSARIYFFTRKADYDETTKIVDRAKNVLTINEYDALLAAYSDEEEEVAVDEFEGVKAKIFAVQCVDELSASKCIREQRLIVDMRIKPHLYLQISGLSFGIPQIIRRETQYVKHNHNGFVVENIEELPKALDFYLDELENWNKAMIKAFEVGENYTTKKLIEKWKEVIKACGED